MRLTARPILWTLAALCVALYIFVLLNPPPNFLVTTEAPQPAGWQALDAQLAVSPVAAPDGTQSALRAIAGSDGSLILRSLRMPRNAVITFSVYLRSDESNSVPLCIWARQAACHAVHVTSQWQRFEITNQLRNIGYINAAIGGSDSLNTGDTIDVWGPQIDIGSSARTYARYDPAAVTWVQAVLEAIKVRVWADLLLWLAAVLAIIAIRMSRRRTTDGKVDLVAISAEVFRADRFHARTIATYAAIFIVTMLLLELATFVANVLRAPPDQTFFAAVRSVYSRAQSDPPADPELHPPQSTIFSPLTQIRRIPGEPTILPYLINRLGLVDNESDEAALRAMPEKPPGVVRIILYGGSTAMGAGVRSGRKTITGQLERLLNRATRPGVLFQVLNFGHGASQTYSDLNFMASMGTYLEPDVSISLNGWNDAFFATESSRYTSSSYILNWTDFSYHYHDAINGLKPPRWVSLPFLPFTSMLFNDIRAARFAAGGRVTAFYDAMPMRLVTREADQSNPLRDRLLLENLRYTAGYFVHRNSYFLSYLQPHPLQFRTLLDTPPGRSEADIVNRSIEATSRNPPDEYRRRMIALFDAYAERYRQLQKEYAEFSNIRFIDSRDALADLAEPAYVDIIHYGTAGQKHLAERMFRDLKEIDVVKRGLKSAQ
jgi:hypothetical protein